MADEPIPKYKLNDIVYVPHYRCDRAYGYYTVSKQKICEILICKTIDLDCHGKERQEWRITYKSYDIENGTPIIPNHAWEEHWKTVFSSEEEAQAWIEKHEN